MKLKEFFPSLQKMARLKRLDPQQLNQPTPNDLPLIVSCTSIPSRFHVLDKVVRSVLNQSKPPRKMLLWLHERHEGTLPESLKRMEGDKFAIGYTSLDSPHCKLVPTLSAYPDATVVTCDDDLMYEPEWLETLWHSHQQHPTDVIAHIARNITYAGNGDVNSYKRWPMVPERDHTSMELLPLGYGGVLYPAGVLPAIASDSELYLQLAPKADDLWFRAVAKQAGVTARTSLKAPSTPYPMPNSQWVSLKKTNVKEDGNRQQWLALEKYFGLGNGLRSM